MSKLYIVEMGYQVCEHIQTAHPDGDISSFNYVGRKYRNRGSAKRYLNTLKAKYQSQGINVLVSESGKVTFGVYDAYAHVNITLSIHDAEISRERYYPLSYPPVVDVPTRMNQNPDLFQ